MSDWENIEALLYSGQTENMELALLLAKGEGKDLRPRFQQLQDCLAFYEEQYRALYSFPKLFNQIREKGLQLSGLGLFELPDCLLALAPLAKSVDISRNKLRKFPLFLLHFQQAETFNLAHNQLVQLPEHFWSLRQIKALHLEDNLLIRLPERIERLNQLEELSISFQRASKLPASLAQLQALKGLFIQLDSLDGFPMVIFELRNLERLILQGQACSSCPKRLANSKTFIFWPSERRL